MPAESPQAEFKPVYWSSHLNSAGFSRTSLKPRCEEGAGWASRAARPSGRRTMLGRRTMPGSRGHLRPWPGRLCPAARLPPTRLWGGDAVGDGCACCWVGAAGGGRAGGLVPGGGEGEVEGDPVREVRLRGIPGDASQNLRQHLEELAGGWPRQTPVPIPRGCRLLSPAQSTSATAGGRSWCFSPGSCHWGKKGL